MASRSVGGLSLIEVLIVVALIVIIAATAIPRVLRSRMAANESGAIGSIRAINIAEATYASRYPELGFTCSLSALGPATSGSPTPKAAGLIEPALASGAKGGYTFALSQCGSGVPVSKYFVVATPQVNRGVRIFCSDQSGVIRYDPGTGSCTTRSEPLQ